MPVMKVKRNDSPRRMRRGLSTFSLSSNPSAEHDKGQQRQQRHLSAMSSQHAPLEPHLIDLRCSDHAHLPGTHNMFALT